MRELTVRGVRRRGLLCAGGCFFRRHGGGEELVGWMCRGWSGDSDDVLRVTMFVRGRGETAGGSEKVCGRWEVLARGGPAKLFVLGHVRFLSPRLLENSRPPESQDQASACLDALSRQGLALPLLWSRAFCSVASFLVRSRCAVAQKMMTWGRVFRVYGEVC